MWKRKTRSAGFRLGFERLEDRSLMSATPWQPIVPVNTTYTVPAQVQTAPNNSSHLTSNQAYIDDEVGNLFIVNLDSGATSFVGHMPQNMLDIAISPTGQLMGVSQDAHLYKINTTNASVSLVGPTTLPFNSLVYRQDGALFGAYNHGLYQINPSTGAITTVRTFNDVAAGDLAFDDSNQLYLTATNGDLLRFNANLTSVVVVGSTSIGNLYGLVYRSDGYLYGTSDSQKIIYRISPVDATTTAWANIANASTTHVVQGIDGAAAPYIAPVRVTNTYVGDSLGNLFTLNTSTGTTALIGQMSVPMTDIALSATGALYGIDAQGHFYEIDPISAKTTFIGNTNATMNSLAFRQDGQLFGAGLNGVFEIDTNTGNTVRVLNLGTYTAAGDIAFDSQYQLYVTTTSGAILRLNAAMTSYVAPFNTKHNDFYGLVYQPDGYLYAVNSNNQLYRINPKTGTVALVGSVSDATGTLRTIFGMANSPVG